MDRDLRTSFGKRCRSLRASIGTSQEQFANSISMDRSLRINRNRNVQRYTRKSEIDRAGFWRFRYYSEFYGALHRVASLLFRLLKRCTDESSREGAALGLFPLLFSLAGAEGFRARLRRPRPLRSLRPLASHASKGVPRFAHHGALSGSNPRAGHNMAGRRGRRALAALRARTFCVSSLIWPTFGPPHGPQSEDKKAGQTIYRV